MFWITALEQLQNQYEEKELKIIHLRDQIDAAKIQLDKKLALEDIRDDKKEVFRALSDEYNKLMEEYNALLAQAKNKEQ